MNKLTKIIATMGPSCRTVPVISSMLDAGLDVARLNFSHGKYQDHLTAYHSIRKLAQRKNKFIGILQDLQGAKIRVTTYHTLPVELVNGKSVTFVFGRNLQNSTELSTDYRHLPDTVSAGDTIYLDDGKIQLHVDKNTQHQIACTVVIGGTLLNRKGVAVPNKKLDLPGVTARDVADLKFGVNMGVDYIAHSFVRKADHIVKIKRLLKRMNAVHIQVIAKIEDREGIENIDSIIDVCDGIMIARGDLGISIPHTEVPLVQEKIIRKCNLAGKPVIVATQMLDSMVANILPTRAEVSDVTTAILQNVDCVMLSGETANGKFPVESVREMGAIIRTVEQNIDYDTLLVTKKIQPEQGNLYHSLAYSVRELACTVNAKSIVVLSLTGKTAKLISWFRPGVPIYTFTTDIDVAESLSLLHGVTVFIRRKYQQVERQYLRLVEELKKFNLLNSGDRVVVTHGIDGKQGTIHLVQVS